MFCSDGFRPSAADGEESDISDKSLGRGIRGGGVFSNCWNSCRVDNASVDEDLSSSGTGEGCISLLTDFSDSCDSTADGRHAFSSPAGGTTIWSLKGPDSTVDCAGGAGNSG